MEQYFYSSESKLFGKFRVRVGVALKIPEWLRRRCSLPSPPPSPLIKEIEMAAIFIAGEGAEALSWYGQGSFKRIAQGFHYRERE